MLVGIRRRCALCHGLFGDLAVKEGQLAHVDHDPSNSSEDNLAFLCLNHHDQYDSKRSQSKGVTPAELRVYRAALEDAMRGAVAVSTDAQVSPVLATTAAPYRLADDTLFIPVGHASPYFATDGDVTCEFIEPRVLVVAAPLRSMRQLLPIFEQTARAMVPLLVFADSFHDEPLSTMVVNAQKRILRSCAIALAEGSREDIRRALARFSKATIFADEAGRTLMKATLEDLGSLARAKIDQRSTVLKAAPSLDNLPPSAR